MKFGILLAVALGLSAGFVAPYANAPAWQPWLWAATAGLVLAILGFDIVKSLAKGEFGLDLLAALSMSVALYFGENLAAAVVALMFASGELLEDYAETRARSEMRALLTRVPKTALRYDDGQLVETAIDRLQPGDRLLIRQGDVVPVDGKVAHGVALLDQSIVTGESVPVHRRPGEMVVSGATSLAGAFDLAATASAETSTYSGIVRLVQSAQATKAPMVRLADRYALQFSIATLVMAGLAWWFNDPAVHETRMLAVLVAATPCPLILAVPVAIISGISRAAQRGLLVKGGPVLETLARAAVLVIDKTGTLTLGHARLTAITAANGHAPDDLLRLAASLDQASTHAIAASLVEAARQRGLVLSHPRDVHEQAGAGITGMIDGHKVALGGRSFVTDQVQGKAMPPPVSEAGSHVAVAIDGQPAGYLLLSDPLRDDAAQLLTRLRRSGINRIVLASGDHRAVVEAIEPALSLDARHSELTPQDKVALVIAERANGVVLMAGDGVNDAPALAAADVGIAMGARGSAAAAEAADAVLLVEELDRIAEGVEIARRARHIALQSVAIGLGLSLASMLAGALGLMTVLQCALAQEVIDVAVILNALRALR